jgi:hypothetical protein
MRQKRRNPNPQARSMDRWFLISVIGLAVVLLIGLFFALSAVGLVSIDLLAAVPLALAGMACAVILFDAFAGLFVVAKSPEPVELPSGPKLA